MRWRAAIPIPWLVCVLWAAPARAGDDVVLVSDPQALAALEPHGLGFQARIDERHWQAIAATLTADMTQIQRADPQSGVGVARHAHRLFDVRWLTAAFTRFELIAVVNRIDKKPLTERGCGDTRLLYRLAYTKDGVSSRLPMTVAVIYRADDDCAAVARRWRPPAGTDLASFLVSEAGPLAPALIDPARLLMVQVNLQSVRWPSAVRPDLAAHAEYLLRTFKPAGDRLAPAKLDNTPDVARLERDPALRAELLAWIRDNLGRIDAASARLPEKFLAERAISVSPRGMARRANRPFRSLFRPADFAELDLTGHRHAGSPAALLRRLDDATCTGCHQARSVAGFHFLGADPPDAVPGNALAVPFSPHLAAELVRRRKLNQALATGGAADLVRPPSERADDDPGGFGAHCGRGDPGFATWSCAPGFECDVFDAPVDDDAVGVCLPVTPATGDPCQIGRVVANSDPHKDRITRTTSRPCAGDQVCNSNKVGFPAGMCTGNCDRLGAGAACGQIAILTPFNNCLARRVPFPRCLAEHVRPATLRACDPARPCRDDYLCVRSEGERGVCIPPYFLFQMRVDGHPQ